MDLAVSVKFSSCKSNCQLYQKEAELYRCTRQNPVLLIILIQFRHIFISIQGFGQQEGHPACKKIGCWFVVGDILTATLHVIATVVTTTTSSTLSSNKIQNGDILLSANPGPLENAH